MLDSIYHMTLKIAFWAENVKIPPLLYRCNIIINIILLLSGLSISMHGVISLSDVTSCDKARYSMNRVMVKIIRNILYLT